MPTYNKGVCVSFGASTWKYDIIFGSVPRLGKCGHKVKLRKVEKWANRMETEREPNLKFRIYLKVFSI